MVFMTFPNGPRCFRAPLFHPIYFLTEIEQNAKRTSSHCFGVRWQIPIKLPFFYVFSARTLSPMKCCDKFVVVAENKRWSQLMLGFHVWPGSPFNNDHKNTSAFKVVLNWPTEDPIDLSCGNIPEPDRVTVSNFSEDHSPLSIQSSWKTLHCLKSTHLWGWFCESLQRKVLKLSLALGCRQMGGRPDRHPLSDLTTDIWTSPLKRPENATKTRRGSARWFGPELRMFAVGQCHSLCSLS